MLIKSLSMEEYYTAPSDDIFEDIKEHAIELWQTYDNEFGYVDEKLDRIKDLKNISDNWAYMIAMFDSNNKYKLLLSLKLEESRELVTRLIAGEEENGGDINE